MTAQNLEVQLPMPPAKTPLKTAIACSSSSSSKR